MWSSHLQEDKSDTKIMGKSGRAMLLRILFLHRILHIYKCNKFTFTQQHEYNSQMDWDESARTQMNPSPQSFCNHQLDPENWDSNTKHTFEPNSLNRHLHKKRKSSLHIKYWHSPRWSPEGPQEWLSSYSWASPLSALVQSAWDALQ